MKNRFKYKRYFFIKLNSELQLFLQIKKQKQDIQLQEWEKYYLILLKIYVLFFYNWTIIIKIYVC